MQKGVFVTATDTGVGKTWLGQQLIRVLVEQEIDVAPRKPVESGWSANNIEQSDAWKLAYAAGKTEQLERICPNHFERAISPVRAALLEGKVITLQQLKQQCLSQLKKPQFLYVEGAGGFYSPLVSDGLNADFAEQLGLPIIIVAEDRLGCINQILLTIEAARQRNLSIIAIFLNKMNNLEITGMDNKQELENYTDIAIIDDVKRLNQMVIKQLLK